MLSNLEHISAKANLERIYKYNDLLCRHDLDIGLTLRKYRADIGQTKGSQKVYHSIY